MAIELDGICLWMQYFTRIEDIIETLKVCMKATEM